MQYWKKTIKLTTLFVLAFSVHQKIVAQENSPYSRYGLGNLKQIENIANRGMGGIAIADDNPLIANPVNPATYTGLKLTAYQIGIEASLVKIKSNNSSNRTGSTTLAYMNIGIPVSKKMGISFGLLPQTRSKYSFAKTDSIDGISKVNYNYYGGGGLQKIYVGAAYKLGEVSVGFNTGYNFGNLVNSSESSFTDSLKILSNNITGRTTMGGAFWQVGALWHKKISTNYSLKIGATYSGAQSINAKKEAYWESFLGDISSPDYVRRIDSVKNLTGKIKIPSNWGVGVILGYGDQWQIGMDLTASDWSKYSAYGNADSFSNMYMIKLGGAFTPDVNSVSDYWKKMTFRAGLYTGQDIFKFNNTNLKKSGATLGIGYPIRRTNSSIGQINAAFEIGKRGTTDNGLVSENYTRFSFGFTFNDKWFIKRRYD